MRELTFVLIGIGTGSLYAMVAQGLVLVYRGSGIVNFAQGAFVLFGAYAYYHLYHIVGVPLIAALTLSVLLTGLLGALVDVLILRPMRRSSAVSRLIVTLGVLMTIQASAVLLYGDNHIVVESLLPTNSVQVFSGGRVGADRMVIFVVGLVLTTVLWALYRFTPYGRVTTAVAQNPRTAATLGHSPDLIAGVNWGVGGALAGLAGALIGPITNLEPVNLPLIVLPALAAALIGGFASFPIAFVASLGIGIAESLMALHVQEPGISQSIPFLVVIAMLVVRGRGLPLRSYLLDRLPHVGAGRIRPVPIMASVAVAATLFLADDEVAAYLTVTVTTAIVCLSVVVVTGYAGQISLAQYVLGGVGAFVAATLASEYELPFLACLLCAAAVAVLVGGLVGMPALRLRGVNLAIVGLGLAVTLFAAVLNNARFSGGVDGIRVPAPSLFGWTIDPFWYPGRYGLVCLAALVLVAIMVANLRRSQVGRRLLAVRASERAAASLGLNVYWVKLYAFMVAAGIAAVGTTLYAFTQSIVLTSQFDVMSSIGLVGVTVVGGVGSVAGGLAGATLVSGGIGTWLLNLGGLQVWLPLIGGLSVLLVLRSDQGGLADMNIALYRAARDAVRARLRRPTPAAPAAMAPSDRTQGPADATPQVADTRPAATAVTGGTLVVEPRELRVEGVGVRYGGVVALADVSLTVRPATVHGVIGPNGAGKTTLVDALTGFASAASGDVWLGERRLTTLSPVRRSRLGLRRSFQSVELFADLTVRENISVGCDDGSLRPYLSALVAPGRVTLSEAAAVAIDKFRLGGMLDRPVESLSFGERRLVAIARAVASAPSVLLLDEPAAGLGDLESAELAELIRALADEWGMGVLLVEHNIDLVLSVCDEVTVLAEGRVLARGTPSEIASHADVVDAYLGSGPASLDQGSDRTKVMLP